MAMNYLVEHAGQIAELAAECGIDWYQISDLRAGKHTNLPVTSSKYKGKCWMWIRERTLDTGEVALRIEFYTNKHGGLNRHWQSHVSRGERQAPAARDRDSDEAKDKRRRERSEAYRKAFIGAPRAESFPYLRRKGIECILKSFDVRVLTDRKVMGGGSIRPFICFPLYSPSGHYVGLQRIYEDGEKKLTAAARDGMYRGAHAIIGDIEAGKIVYVAEGFATAVSIHLATGLAVAFAYSAGNLDPVCAFLSSKYSDKEIIIAADNDCKPEGNTGIFKAWEAARANRKKGRALRVSIPPLISGKKADWNDIHVHHGLESMQRIFGDPENIGRPSPDRTEFLYELLSYARGEQQAAIVRKLAVALRVPHLMAGDDLVQKVMHLLGSRGNRSMIIKAVRSVIIAGKYKAQRIAAMSGKNVSSHLRFLTERSQDGHLVISPTAVDAVMEELSRGAAVIVKAPMGTGKTEILIRRAMAGATRAAHILPRVSVVDDAAGRLKLDHYRDIDQFKAYFTDQMVSCINSMGALRFMADNGRSWFENLDVLCLDEATQVLPQVTQLGKAHRRKENHDALIKSMRTARSILIADADANEFLLTELRRIDPERRIVLVEIEHPPLEQKRWTVQVTDSITETRAQLVASVLAGERCLLATDNRRKAIETERLIRAKKPGVRILNIHREPTRENIERIRKFYDNPNEACLGYDVLIYSPAITSGVSLTGKHFTRHFGIFTGIIKVTDIMQMLGRDRTAGEWLLAISPRNWSDEKRTAGLDLQAAIGEAPTLFSDLKFATDLYEVEARENLFVLAVSILKLKGHRVSLATHLEGKLGREMEGLLGEIGKALKAERVRRILGQEDISEADYMELKHRWMPDQEEAAAMLAYRIRHILCAELNEESISFVDQGGLKKIALFETLLAPNADIQRFDQNEKLSIDPSQRFYAAEKKRMLGDMFQILGLDGKSFAGEFTHAECQKVVAYFQQHSEKANLLFQGIVDPARTPRCPTSFVQRIFRQLGLRLGARKSNGRMIRFLEKSDIDLMITLAERRRAGNQTFIPAPPQPQSAAA